MRKAIITFTSIIALCLTGAIAAPAAQANGYSKAENRFWVANLEWDRKAARHGGKRTTVRSGKDICREFDRRTVDGVMWAFMERLSNDRTASSVRKQWGMQTALLAPMYLCPRHLDDMDDFVDAWLYAYDNVNGLT